MAWRTRLPEWSLPSFALAVRGLAEAAPSAEGDGDSADLRLKYLLQMEATSIRGGK